MTAQRFASEAELCAAFIAEVGDDWTAYPETAGFDILLSRKADGFQVGVEAKLRLNAVVLSQALDGDGSYYREHGPDCRAVLVPDGAVVAGIPGILPHLAITVIRMRLKLPGGYGPAFFPNLPIPNDCHWRVEDDWHELCPLKRYELPAYVPDVPAGASGPVQLTDWKIKAIKIAVLLEARGHVTRADFKALKIDIRRWVDGRWLLPGPDGFTAGPRCPDFRTQHPTVYAQIAAEADEWGAAA